jgi:hypothetical protein
MAEADASPRRRTWLVVGLALVVIVVAVAGGVVLANRGSSKRASVTFEPARSAGENPFSDSVAVGTPTTFPKAVLAAIAKTRARLPIDKKTGTRVISGTAPGAYGGNGATPVCDASALVSSLQKNPGNGAAWAKAFGITPKDIATFVAGLTPVVLTNDTRVTNHGYDHATVAPRQSILQAGSPVMVDTTGVPRVACTSGNPLAATRPIIITKTHGDAWPGFSSSAVTTVAPGPATHTLTLINTQTGVLYQQPTGSSGVVVGGGGGTPPVAVAGQWVVAEPFYTGADIQKTVIRVLGPNSPWTATATLVREGVAGLAWGNDEWIAVTNANNGGKGNHVLESADLRTWKQVAALPNRLTGVAFGNGRWTATALHAAAPTSPGAASLATGIIYTSTDAVHWAEVAQTNTPSNGRRQPVAFGNGRWLTAVATDTVGAGVLYPVLTMFTSRDGQRWAANGSHIVGQFSPSMTFGAGQWAIGSTTSAVGSAVVSTSPDGSTWTPSSTGLGLGFVSGIAYGGNSWMAAVTDTSVYPTTTLATSADAKTWKAAGTFHNYISALTYGSAPLASSPTTASTAPAPQSAR